MDSPTSQQVSSTIRLIIGYAVTYAIGRGWLTPANSAPITDLLVQLAVPALALAHIIYSAWAKRPAAQVAAVASMDNVAKVVMKTKAEADAVPVDNAAKPPAVKASD